MNGLWDSEVGNNLVRPQDAVTGASEHVLEREESLPFTDNVLKTVVLRCHSSLGGAGLAFWLRYIKRLISMPRESIRQAVVALVTFWARTWGFPRVCPSAAGPFHDLGVGWIERCSCGSTEDRNHPSLVSARIIMLSQQ